MLITLPLKWNWKLRLPFPLCQQLIYRWWRIHLNTPHLQFAPQRDTDLFAFQSKSSPASPAIHCKRKWDESVGVLSSAYCSEAVVVGCRVQQAISRNECIYHYHHLAARNLFSLFTAIIIHYLYNWGYHSLALLIHLAIVLRCDVQCRVQPTHVAAASAVVDQIRILSRNNGRHEDGIRYQYQQQQIK